MEDLQTQLAAKTKQCDENKHQLTDVEKSLVVALAENEKLQSELAALIHKTEGEIASLKATVAAQMAELEVCITLLCFMY